MFLNGLLILWTILGVLFGTAIMSIRSVSRTRLMTVLRNRGREKLADAFFANQRAYARTAVLCHQLFAILFALTLSLQMDAMESGYVRALAVFGACVGWILLFGVGIPVGWARYAGNSYLARALPFLNAIRLLAGPMLMIINGVDELVRRLSGAPKEEQDSQQIELEIMDIVSRGETSGAVDASERAIIKSAMVLDETHAGEIMTPRTDMIGVEVESDYDGVLELFQSCGHSRIPVYEGTLDHVVGVLYAKDLLKLKEPASFSLRRTMRDANFVPETKDLASLLREFQANRVHIAIVLDEYGGTAGLVTIEDILEELVGEITDEHDEAPPTPPISPIDSQSAEVDARVRIDELNESLNVTLPEDDSYDTVGGYVFSKLGRIPSVGETMVEGDVKIEVLEARERTVNRLRVSRVNSAPQE